MKNWKHIGGGCDVGTAAKGKKYPCDDSYENVKTKKVVTVYSTTTAHFKMPQYVNSISELLKRGCVNKQH